MPAPITPLVLVHLCGAASVAPPPPGEILIESTGLRSVSVDDVDLDGRPDLITTDTGVLTIRHAFAEPQPGPVWDVPVGTAPNAVLVRDVDADGVPDLLVADGSDNTVGVYLARKGGYERTADHLFVRRGPRYMDTADLDRDGVDDLVVANGGSTAEVFVFRGQGAGRFTLWHAFPTPRMHRGMALRDFDGDGLEDLALAMLGPPSEPNSAVRVYPGAGDGTFGTPAVWPVPNYVSGMACDNFDGDGRPDLATSSGSGREEAGLLINLGGGAFRVAGPIQIGQKTGSVAAADLDADGRPDLVFGHRSSNSDYPDTVDFFRNAGDGVFERAATAYVGRNTRVAAAGALDAAGRVGVVMHVDDPERVTVVPMDAFARPVARRHVALEGRPRWVQASDLNRDGVTDLVVSGDGPFRVLMSGPGGLLGAVDTPDATGWIVDIELADLNGDGLDDLVFANLDFTGTGAMINRGDGTFEPVPVLYARDAVGVADVTGDGLPDFISPGIDRVAVHPGDGAGRPGQPVNFGVVDSPDTVEIGDFNADGLADVLAVIPGDGPGVVRLQVLSGREGGSLAVGPPIDLPGAVAAVRVADLDDDGRDDLLVVAASDGGVRLIRSEPGGFTQVATLAAGESVGDAHAADVTGDGVTDVFVSLPERDAVLLFAGLGGGAFAPARPFLAGSEPLGLAAGDFDADGVADMGVVDAGIDNPPRKTGVSLLAPMPCAADLRAPFGVIDAADAAAFAAAFATGDHAADLAPPFGTLDYWDVRRFVGIAAGGCP